jgi:hypothetical protein
MQVLVRCGSQAVSFFAVGLLVAGCMADEARHGAWGRSEEAPVVHAATPTAPMLAMVDTVVDPALAMNVEPGQGVGVFVEYWPGGRWHLSWTCDTALSQQACDFNIAASVATGTARITDAIAALGAIVTSPSVARVEIRASTQAELHGLWIETTPGAVLTLEASVGDLKDGSFLFFVQNGAIRGGYKGLLSNPLQLQGTKP